MRGDGRQKKKVFHEHQKSFETSWEHYVQQVDDFNESKYIKGTDWKIVAFEYNINHFEIIREYPE